MHLSCYRPGGAVPAGDLQAAEDADLSGKQQSEGQAGQLTGNDDDDLVNGKGTTTF